MENNNMIPILLIQFMPSKVGFKVLSTVSYVTNSLLKNLNTSQIQVIFKSFLAHDGFLFIILHPESVMKLYNLPFHHHSRSPTQKLLEKTINSSSNGL
jgi:hypothetical protein